MSSGMDKGVEPIGQNWAKRINTDSEIVKREFDSYAANYDAQMVVKWGHCAHTDASRIAARYLLTEVCILDAGCGTGLSGQALHDRSFTHISGVDLSNQMLKQAEQREVYSSLRQADLNKRLSFEDDAFGVVVCVAVLSHFSNAVPTMLEFCRVTQPGGYIIFSHRKDLYVKYGYKEQLMKLERSGDWQHVYRSKPMPYLPNHPEYRDEILVNYHVYCVLGCVSNKL